MKKIFLHGLFIVIIIIASISLTTYSTYGKYTDTSEELLNYKNEGIILTDRNGDVFYATHNARERKFIPLEETADSLEYSILTAEDKEFYSHSGISLQGIARSIVLNIQNKSLSYGGSTITQQLVKNTLLSSERNFLRKYQEALLTFLVERNFTKEEILAMYLNSVYFGEGLVGIDEASRAYFSKEASDLTLAESSYLASILKSPNYYSPSSGNLDEAMELQKNLLERMRNEGIISNEEYEAAVGERLAFNEDRNIHDSQTAFHAALYVISLLEERYGEDVVYEGLKVKTTLHLPWQEVAQEEVAKGVEREKKNGAGNGAAVVMDPKTGEVLAMVGSHDWSDQQNGKINMAVSPRSPGSSFKPVVYALALENETITPATTLTDRPRTFQENYKPQNYDRKFRGSVPVRRALANSLNVPAVEVMEKVGIQQVLVAAPNFGITTLGNDTSQYGLSLVLGSGEVPLIEMVNAYGTFANEGIRQEPIIISEIYDKFGEKIYTSSPQSHEVLSQETSFLISSILSDKRARREAFGSALDVPYTTAVKTGTSEDYRDAWTIGYTPNLVVGVWVGNNDNSPMNRVAGSLGAAPIWKTLMTKFIPEKGKMEFRRPDGIVQATICVASSFRNGNSASRSAIAITEYFREDTKPTNRRCSPSRQNIAAADPASPSVSSSSPRIDLEIEREIEEMLQNLPQIGGIQVDAEENNEEEKDN